MGLSMVRQSEAVEQVWETEQGSKETLWHYFGGLSEDGLGPQGFLTSVTRRTIRAHCHGVDQFQIMFASPGARYQRHDIPPILVHYADAYSTYGPIRGEDPSLHFFTLRPRYDRSMHYMPDDRDDVPYLAHRQRHVDLDDVAAETPSDAGVVERHQVIDAEDDGMEAFALTAGPGASIEVPVDPATRGQFVYVASGKVTYEGEEYEVLSLGWHAPDEGPVTFQAGPEGARVVVTRFGSVATELKQAS